MNMLSSIISLVGFPKEKTKPVIEVKENEINVSNYALDYKTCKMVTRHARYVGIFAMLKNLMGYRILHIRTSIPVKVDAP